MEIAHGNWSETLPVRISDFVARNIGGGVTSERVQEVIENMTLKGYLVHGVKDEEDYEKVRDEGIAPLTPEGTGVTAGGDVETQKQGSFWTSGVRVFHSGEEDISGWATYDTSFFHWAHSRGGHEGSTRMNLALVSMDRIRKNHPEFRIDPRSSEYTKLNFPVPRDQIILLRVVVNHGATKLSARAYGKIAEQKMFALLEEALEKGSAFGPGRELEINLDQDSELAA